MKQKKISFEGIFQKKYKNLLETKKDDKNFYIYSIFICWQNWRLSKYSDNLKLGTCNLVVYFITVYTYVIK